MIQDKYTTDPYPREASTSSADEIALLADALCRFLDRQILRDQQAARRREATQQRRPHSDEEAA